MCKNGAVVMTAPFLLFHPKNTIFLVIERMFDYNETVEEMLNVSGEGG
jgi:hypothetical protein